MKLYVESVSPEQLIEDLAVDNPPPEENWFRRGDFEPTYGAKELRTAAKKGWIELKADEDPELWAFRLTPDGRQALEKMKQEKDNE